MSPAAEAEVRSTILALHDIASSNGLPWIDRPITVFVYHDLDALAAEFESATGRDFEEWFWPDFKAGKGMILDSKDYIALNTSSERYQELSPDERRRSLAKSLFHVYRRSLTTIWEGTPRHAVSREGPKWLSEGSAEYFTYRAIGPLGSEWCDLTRSRLVGFHGSETRPLSELETSEGYYSVGFSRARQFGFPAAELLAAQAGGASIFAYYASLRTGISWQDAFEQAFGMTVAKFYQLFEEHRAAGFPEPGVSQSSVAPMTTPGPFSELLQDPSLPHYIEWNVGSNVDRSDVESAIRGVKLMHEFAQSLDLPDPSGPITITIYKDMEKMACKYSMATGWDLETSTKYWENGGAVAGRGSVHISGSAPERLNSDPQRLMRTLVHELTHVHFQTGQVGFPQRSGESPRWLGEGTALLVERLLLQEDYPDAFTTTRTRAGQISRAEATGLALRDAEVWPPSEGGTRRNGPSRIEHSCLHIQLWLLCRRAVGLPRWGQQAV